MKNHRYTTRNSNHNYTNNSTTISNNNNSNIIINNNNNNKRVNFRPLPFYDQICELIPSSRLESAGVVGRVNETVIEFKLNIDQADQIAMDSGRKHIILRFCSYDLNGEQDDNFPPDVTITVNGAQVLLPPAISNPNKPNVPAKRPGQHVDITKLSKLCPYVQNSITVKWYPDPTDQMKTYAITVLIGQRAGSEILLERIKGRGSSDPNSTKAMISDSDTEVATTNLQCSLVCPLGKMRMSAPCKSVHCQHIPCFDAMIYLQMNERKPTWICPICYKPAYFPDLLIDGYFVEILEKTGHNITEVSLHSDGTWSPVLKMEQPASAKNPPPEIITISDDDDD